MLETIVSAPDRGALDRATTGFYLDLTPPTDCSYGFVQSSIPRVAGLYRGTQKALSESR
jgi:hypothetical protein